MGVLPNVTRAITEYVCVFLIFLKITCCVEVEYPEFIVEELCLSGNNEVRLDSNGASSIGILKATKNAHYSLPLTCKVILRSPKNFGIILSIRNVDMRVVWDGECKDFIKIQIDKGGKKKVVTLCAPKKDWDEAEYYSTDVFHGSPIQAMELRYHTGSDLNNFTSSGHSGFEFIITSYSYEQKLNSDRFECENKKQIWNRVVCDGHNNCGDESDEINDVCGTKARHLTMVIIVSTIAGVCCLSFILFFLVYYLQKKRRRTDEHEMTCPPPCHPAMHNTVLPPRTQSAPAFLEDQNKQYSYKTFENEPS